MLRHLFPSLILASAVVAAGACTRTPGDDMSPTAPSGGTLQVLVDVPILVESSGGLVGTWNWAGQSVTTPAGARFDTLRFNWYRRVAGASEPTAFGTLYLLDRPYTGLPGDLGMATPGVIAASAPAPVDPTGGSGQGAEYAFDDGVSIVGGTTYWFYTGAQGSFATTFDTDEYAGGQLYLTGHPSQPFREISAAGRMVNGVFVPPPVGVTVDANFRLRGIPRN